MGWKPGTILAAKRRTEHREKKSSRTMNVLDPTPAAENVIQHPLSPRLSFQYFDVGLAQLRSLTLSQLPRIRRKTPAEGANVGTKTGSSSSQHDIFGQAKRDQKLDELAIPSRPVSDLGDHDSTLVAYLTESQYLELWSLFKRCDVNNTGTIDKKELSKLISLLGAPGCRGQLEELLGIIDGMLVDENLEWDEFLVLAARILLIQLGNEEMHMAFSVFESDSGGMVQTEEIREMLTTTGEVRLSDAEVDELLALADPSRSGKVRMADLQNLPCWKLADIQRL